MHRALRAACCALCDMLHVVLCLMLGVVLCAVRGAVCCVLCTVRGAVCSACYAALRCRHGCRCCVLCCAENLQAGHLRHFDRWSEPEREAKRAELTGWLDGL